MLNLASIMIGSHDPEGLAKFYEDVFERTPDWKDEKWFGWQIGGTHFTLGEHSEVSGKAKEPQRMMFNLETKDVEGEFERMKKAGAEVVKEPYEMGGGLVATLSDPEGNYFQLMTPWEN